MLPKSFDIDGQACPREDSLAQAWAVLAPSLMIQVNQGQHQGGSHTTFKKGYIDQALVNGCAWRPHSSEPQFHHPCY